MTGLTGRMGTTSAVIAAVGLAACLVGTPSSMAQEADELGDVFGQSSPSDTAGKGEREIASEAVGQIGRAGGRYHVFSGKTQLEFGIAEGFSVGPGLLTTAASIRNIDGLDDVNGFAVTGGSVEFKALILDRGKSGLGLAVLAEPFLTFGDTGSNSEAGSDVRGRGVEFRLAGDRALVPGSLYANVNLAYGLNRTTTDLATTDTSDLLVSGALTYRVSGKLFVGVEARYVRDHFGLALNELQGQALLVGPTLLWQPDPKIAITATGSPQVWGRDVGGGDGDSRFDTANFERHQGKLKVAVPF